MKIFTYSVLNTKNVVDVVDLHLFYDKLCIELGITAKTEKQKIVKLDAKLLKLINNPTEFLKFLKLFDYTKEQFFQNLIELNLCSDFISSRNGIKFLKNTYFSTKYES